MGFVEQWGPGRVVGTGTSFYVWLKVFVAASGDGFIIDLYLVTWLLSRSIFISSVES